MIDGTADLRIVNQEAAKEEFVPDPTELEIERIQEEQKIALAHGGFADMAEFQEALKAGAGADFHAKSGYPGMMGGSLKDHAEVKEKEEDPIHKILKAQKEAAEKSARAPKMDKTGASGEDVVTKAPRSEQPRTATSSSAASAASVEEKTSAASVAPVPAEETARAKDEL